MMKVVEDLETLEIPLSGMYSLPTHRRSFHNKVRDNWREENKQGDKILPKDYSTDHFPAPKPKMSKTMPRSSSMNDIHNQGKLPVNFL